MIDTYCGLCCEGCAFQNEPYHCGGCIKTQGNPFHGACPVAACCREKGCVHCGECADFPCPLLHDYSYDAQHGDDGARIKQCAAWAASREKSRYPQIYAYLMSKPVTAWDFKVKWQWQRFHVDGKHFAVIRRSEQGNVTGLSLKLPDEDHAPLREKYTAITPAYYMNKVQWSNIDLQGDVPDEVIKALIDTAYADALRRMTKKRRRELFGEE